MSRAPVALVLAVLSATLSLLVGCSSGGKLGGVTVNVVSLAPMAQGDNQLALTVRYMNENVLPIGLSGSKHKLSLNGTVVGQVVSSQPVGLPQLSAANQTVTLTLNRDVSLSQVSNLATNGQASYRIESVLYVTAGEEKLEIKTQGSGAVDVSALRTTGAP